MGELVLLSRDARVGILTVNNPSVNAVSPGVPEGIAQGIDEFSRAPAIDSIVLIGGGRTFIAGADIRQFGKITACGNRDSGPGLTQTRLRRHPRSRVEAGGLRERSRQVQISPPPRKFHVEACHGEFTVAPTGKRARRAGRSL